MSRQLTLAAAHFSLRLSNFQSGTVVSINDGFAGSKPGFLSPISTPQKNKTVNNFENPRGRRPYTHDKNDKIIRPANQTTGQKKIKIEKIAFC